MSDQIFTCTPRQTRNHILSVIEAGLVPFVTSSPGMGKSTIMRDIATDAGYELIDHRMSTSVPEDMSGLPEFYTNEQGNRRARFVPFGDLFPLQDVPVPNGKKGWMLFLDEFNSAEKQTQAAAYKLILDRMTGQHKLHDQVLITAAGNLATDRAITNVMGTATQSRIVHIEMKVDFEEWLLDVALAQNYDSRVIGYLSQFPSKLMDFVPNHKNKTFCCPRTWEFVNRLVKGKGVTQDMTSLLAGTITPGEAVNFVQFCEIYKKLIRFETIMANPDTAPVPDDPSLKWATVTHLLEKLDKDTAAPLLKYMNRFSFDFRVLFVRSVMIRQPQLRAHPAMQDIMLETAKRLRE